MKDEANRICPVDFEQTGVAPSAFMAMVLKSREHWKLAGLVLPHLKSIEQVPESTLEILRRAFTVCHMGTFTWPKK